MNIPLKEYSSENFLILHSTIFFCLNIAESLVKTTERTYDLNISLSSLMTVHLIYHTRNIPVKVYSKKILLIIVLTNNMGSELSPYITHF